MYVLGWVEFVVFCCGDVGGYVINVVFYVFNGWVIEKIGIIFGGVELLLIWYWNGLGVYFLNMMVCYVDVI